jgi:hypothetical protein
MIVKKDTDGKLVIARSTSNQRSWFIVKAAGIRPLHGVISVKNIRFPEKFIGKRVRFVVEVLK